MPTPLRHRWLCSALLLASASLLGLAACDDDTQATTPSPSPKAAVEGGLRRLESCDELRSSAVDVVLTVLVQEHFTVHGDAGGSNNAPGPSEEPTDRSATNTQEADLDEADLVKTDGEFIYLAHGTGLTILRAWPASETEKLSELELGDRAHSLFVEGDRALVFSELDAQSAQGGRSGLSRATVVDLSDRARPRVLRQIDVEGSIAHARLVDGRAHFIANLGFELPSELQDLLHDPALSLPAPYEDRTSVERDQARAQTRELLRPHVQEIVARLPVETWLPLYRDTLDAREGAELEPLLACDQVFAPDTLLYYGMVNLLSLDLRDDRAELQATGLYSDSQNVYASQDSLYIAQNNLIQWPWPVGQQAQTQLHKFTLGATPRYEASGVVPGLAFRHFALHEHDGHLRVATFDDLFLTSSAELVDTEDSDNDGDTTEVVAAPTPASNVFVLEQHGPQLDVVGQARGITPGQQLQAARMMGDKGYLVTSQQTDPLVTLDLSDPSNPRVVGELHVPGRSRYLQPLGEDHLLAVGRADDGLGHLRGIQLRVFDVSDPANPTVAHEHELALEGQSESDAELDYRAITFHRGVLSLPLMTWQDHRDEDGAYISTDLFNGLLAFSVDAQGGIEELGRVDHGDLWPQQRCPYADINAADCDEFYRNSWEARVRRSVYIEDNLFSISAAGVKVSDLYDPSRTLTSVALDPGR